MMPECLPLPSGVDLSSSCAPMKFSVAIDRYFADQKMAGRINSDRSEESYREVLDAHSEDVSNRDPSKTGREDCKKTLERWAHPNTQLKNRSILVSFYDWMMEEGHRGSNPARMTRRPKKRPTEVYRLTREEASAMLRAARGSLERRAIYLGLCAGLRSEELRSLQRRHLDRDGLVHVSADIAKGGKERWIPVLEELEPIVHEIRWAVSSLHFILPGLDSVDPSRNIWRPAPTRPMSTSTLKRLVAKVARRAGIEAHVHPHLLRHAYGDHIARSTGVLIAKEMLGHADVKTTMGYVDRPGLDELSLAVRGLRYQRENSPETPMEEPENTKPPLPPSAPQSHKSVEPNLDGEAIQ